MEYIPIIERAVEDRLRKDMNRTVAKSLEWGVDFMGFGLHAKKLFRTWQDWEDYRWNEKYSRINISVNIVPYQVKCFYLVWYGFYPFTCFIR